MRCWKRRRWLLVCIGGGAVTGALVPRPRQCGTWAQHSQQAAVWREHCTVRTYLFSVQWRSAVPRTEQHFKEVNSHKASLTLPHRLWQKQTRLESLWLVQCAFRARWTLRPFPVSALQLDLSFTDALALPCSQSSWWMTECFIVAIMPGTNRFIYYIHWSHGM